jgi:hypothetical protein
MPLPSEHAARIAQPLPSNLAIYARKSIAPGVSIILQKSKGATADAPMSAQSYRFNKNQFTAEEAKAWLKKHGLKFISFEPASEPVAQEERKNLINRITKELSNSII